MGILRSRTEGGNVLDRIRAVVHGDAIETEVRTPGGYPARNDMKKYVVFAAAMCILYGSSAFGSVRGPVPKDGLVEPVYPPITGEYYPTKPGNFPVRSENPYPQIQTVAYTGGTLEVFLQTNMVTQIQFPAPPVLINIGKAEDFVIEVIPEFNSVFVKPLAKIAMTNMIVTTERGVYTFMLKENPWRPFHMRFVVTDPYRQVQPDDTQTLLWMAYNGVRPPEFQFYAMEIRNINTSQFVYDPTTETSARVTMKRAVALPKANKSVYWIEFANLLPPGIKSAGPGGASFMIDEKSVWAPYVSEIAVPGTQNSGVPLLSKNDKVDMFLICDTGTIPQMFQIRFMLQGTARNLPIEARFSMQRKGPAPSASSPGPVGGVDPVSGVPGFPGETRSPAPKDPVAGQPGTKTVAAEESIDARIRRMYEESVRKQNIPTTDMTGKHRDNLFFEAPAPSVPTNPSPVSPAPGDGEKIFFIEP